MYNDVRVLFIEKPQVMFDQILDGCSPKITEQLCGQKRMFGKAWNVIRLEDFMNANSQTIWMLSHRRFGRSKREDERSLIIEMSSIQTGSLFKIENRRWKKFLWEMGFRRSEKISFCGENPNLTRRSTDEGLKQHETRRGDKKRTSKKIWGIFVDQDNSVLRLM